jgi:hypothetical protein
VFVWRGTMVVWHWVADVMVEGYVVMKCDVEV